MSDMNPQLSVCELFQLQGRQTSLSMIRLDAGLTRLRTLRWDPAHAEQVTCLALMLFDQLTAVHRLGSEARDILAVAGLLHDIGWVISRKQHHKHSMNLILEEPLNGFDARGSLLVANVARYHRRAFPCVDHRMFGILTEADRSLVMQLAAIIRIADGLDRTHAQVIHGVVVDWRETECLVRLTSSNGAGFESEIEGAMLKADLFQAVFKRRVRFEKVDGTLGGGH